MPSQARGLVILIADIAYFQWTFCGLLLLKLDVYAVTYCTKSSFDVSVPGA